MTAATTPALARCVIRGCPVRYRAGDNRLCPWHGADDTNVDLATRAAGFGVVMTAFDGEPTTEAGIPRPRGRGMTTSAMCKDPWDADPGFLGRGVTLGE
jgi:hypothetical protein